MMPALDWEAQQVADRESHHRPAGPVGRALTGVRVAPQEGRDVRVAGDDVGIFHFTPPSPETTAANLPSCNRTNAALSVADDIAWRRHPNCSARCAEACMVPGNISASGYRCPGARFAQPPRALLTTAPVTSESARETVSGLPTRFYQHSMRATSRGKYTTDGPASVNHAS